MIHSLIEFLKLSLGCVFLSVHLFAWTDPADDLDFENPSHPLFISLGSHCAVAVLTRANHLRICAFPFDWLLTLDTAGIVSALNEDFENFFNKEVLFPHPSYPNVAENAHYKIEYLHDGPILQQEDLWQSVKEKYERRIHRFRQIAEFPRKVFFIRVAYDVSHAGPTYWLNEGQTAINFDQARALKEALDAYFPSLDFTLVILNYKEDLPSPIARIPGVIEFKIRKSHREADYQTTFEILSSPHL